MHLFSGTTGVEPLQQSLLLEMMHERPYLRPLDLATLRECRLSVQLARQRAHG